MIDWRPGASLDTLRLAASLRRRVREHFDASGALEVVTPVLSGAGATEPAIEPFDTRATRHDGHRWLQTSPEFPMKRLIAAYGCDIWQLAPVFRRAETGARHNGEFQLLEWYRVGIDADALMDDIAVLLATLSAVPVGNPAANPTANPTVVSAAPPFRHRPGRQRHGVLVKQVAGRWPEALSVADIASLFAQAGRHFPDSISTDEPDAALDLLFDTLVVPRLPTDRATFVTGYPASQASLARLTIDADGRTVADRFELYAGGVELANGFHELLDAGEQAARFEQDLSVRRARGQPVPPVDTRFLDALRAGMPACSGVALGLDRLTMLLAGTESLDDVMAFSDVRA